MVKIDEESPLRKKGTYNIHSLGLGANDKIGLIWTQSVTQVNPPQGVGQKHFGVEALKVFVFSFCLLFGNLKVRKHYIWAYLPRSILSTRGLCAPMLALLHINGKISHGFLTSPIQECWARFCIKCQMQRFLCFDVDIIGRF